MLEYTLDPSSIGAQDVLKGDANGDGMVNITDVVYIIDYINGNAAADFNAEAANMNPDDDQEINITDVVLVIDIINATKK